MTRDVDAELKKINSDSYGAGSLFKLVGNVCVPIAAAAAEALIRQFPDDKDVMKKLLDMLHYETMQREVMGTTRLSHWTVGCLLDSRRSHLVLAAEGEISRWPEPDKQDLTWYLNNR